MTDRELLELAAKAAGINIFDWTPGGRPTTDGSYDGIWNPLTDDGDALRLAVSLKMEVYHAWDGGHSAYASVPQEDSRPVFCVEPHMSDPGAATRRAIVRAAAADCRQCRHRKSNWSPAMTTNRPGSVTQR